MFNYKMLFILLLVNTYQVNAVTVQGNSTAVFTGDAGETSFLQWGGVFTDKSSLEISGNDFSITDEQPFKIATLTYTNSEIREVLASNTGVSVQLDFTEPAIANSFVFNYDIEIDETSNNSNNSDDTVKLMPANGSDFLLGSMGGQDIMFKLLGFDNGAGDFEEFFIQAENSNAPVDLFAKITVAAVPLPSALWLFITAFMGFFTLNKRKVLK